MLAAERRHRIKAEVGRRGSARVTELAALLDASEMTIRRDLDALHDAGAIVKVYGGATATSNNGAFEPGFDAKSQTMRAEKAEIARTAAEFVHAGMSIGLSAGTTTWRLARELLDIAHLTVITNSISVAGVFHSAPDASRTVVITGGVRTPSDALVGPIATTAISQVNVDTLFLGVHGMSPEGFSTPNLDEADVDRTFIKAARQLIVVADHTKWGTAGLARIAALSEADTLITDAALPDDARLILDDQVPNVVTTPTPLR